jgi:hypothetical protein
LTKVFSPFEEQKFQEKRRENQPSPTAALDPKMCTHPEYIAKEYYSLPSPLSPPRCYAVVLCGAAIKKVVDTRGFEGVASKLWI